MTKYDATKTGTLNHEEVKAMASELLTVWTPLVGGVTDEEVDLIMRIGGETAKPEITVEQLPLALSGMVALKETNQGLTELFAKYDTASDDGSVFSRDSHLETFRYPTLSFSVGTTRTPPATCPSTSSPVSSRRSTTTSRSASRTSSTSSSR